MAAIEDWDNTLSGLRHDNADVILTMPIKPSKAGGSGSFLALANDGHQYWVKPLNNLQGERVPITEQIVGRAGALIDAPVCSVRTAEIPPALAGWEFRPGAFLEPGIAHASLSVSNATEHHALEYRPDDDNPRRHLFILTLYDWCWGDDPQWLVALGEDHAYYSHDHGWYLPPGGPAWSRSALLRHVADANAFPDSGSGLARSSVAGIAARLRSLTQHDIRSVLAAIPTSWPVTDQELEAVGFFLDSRAPAVADRLESRFP